MTESKSYLLDGVKDLSDLSKWKLGSESVSRCRFSKFGHKEMSSLSSVPENLVCRKKSSLGFKVLVGLDDRIYSNLVMSFVMWPFLNP